MNVDENDDTHVTHDDPAAQAPPQAEQIISVQSSLLASPPAAITEESLSKRAVQIMNATSGLCADPIHYHSYTAIGNLSTPGGGRFQLPTPKGIFASVFHKCIFCHQRLGGGGGGGGASCNRRECTATANATKGMLQCVACGVYAHRSCAFARPISISSSSEGGPALCVVNLIEIQKALGMLLEEDDNDKPTINPSPPATTMTSLTLQSSSSSSSSISWSIFGGGSMKLTTPMETTNNHDSHSTETAVSTIAATSSTTKATTATTPALICNEEKRIETTTSTLIQSIKTATTTTTTNNSDINPPSSSTSTSWTIANVVNGYTGKESYEFGDVTKRILFGKRVTTTTTTNNSDIDDNDDGGCSTIVKQQQQSNLIIIDNVTSTAIDNNYVSSQSSSSKATTLSSSSSWSIFGNTKSSSSSLMEETKNNTMNTDPVQATTSTVEEDECRRDSIVTTTSTIAPPSSSSWSIFGTSNPSTTINSSDGGGRGWERISSLSSEDNNNANNTLSQLVRKEIAVTDEPTLPSLSSSWSIFGKKSVTTEDAMDDISPLNSSCIDNKKDEINCLEEVKEPIINIVKTTTNDEEQQSVITPGGVLVSAGAKFATKTTTTTFAAAKTTTSTIGTVVGGVAGFAIAGPVGSIVGSQIGRNISTVGITLVESGVGLSYLVVDIAKAANFKPIRSINSEKKERELKLINSTLVLVRPDIYVEPIWGDYATEARRLWELKMQKSISSSSSSSSTSSVSVFNNTNNSSKDERNVRYQKDIDIIKAEAGELTMKDKIFLLVNRILNDKLSLPGYQYRYLILKHKRRTVFGTNDDNHVVPTADVNDHEYDEPSLRSCRQDAHGIIKHITATLLEVRPGLASSSTMTELTACAVETLIFLELYDDCLGEIKLQMEEKDENLVAKMKALKKKYSSAERTTTSVGNNNSISKDGDAIVPFTTTVSKLAIVALQSLPPAHTPTEKLLHCVEFLECISIHFSTTFHGKCIDADTMLLMVCQHVLVANVPHLHAEVAFIEEFYRDEQLLCGKEGYALITLQASLHYLDSLEELPCDVLPSMETECIK